MNENKEINVFDRNSELIAMSTIMELEYMIHTQNEDDKIKTTLIIAAAMIDKIISTGKYTFDEVVNEIRKNHGIVKKILKRMKEEDEEDDD